MFCFEERLTGYEVTNELVFYIQIFVDPKILLTTLNPWKQWKWFLWKVGLCYPAYTDHTEENPKTNFRYMRIQKM